MKPLTTKQQQRIEKKKKKMAAYLEIAKLNDRDREAKAALLRNRKIVECMENDASTMEATTPDGPSRKRHKKNNSTTNMVIEDDSAVGTEGIAIGETQADAMETQSECQPSEEIEEQEPEPQSTPGEQMDYKSWLGSTNLPRCSGQASTNNETPTDEASCSCSRNAKKLLTGEELSQLKREIKERKNKSKYVPKFRLKAAGDCATLAMQEGARTALFLSDIQHLLLYALLGQQAPYWPTRWCVLDRWNRLTHIVVLIFEGVSMYDFMSQSSNFPFINSTFETQVEVVMPSSYSGNLVEELVSIPLTELHKDRLIKEHGSLEAAMKCNEDVYKGLRSIFPIDNSCGVQEAPEPLPTADHFSRTKLLLSASQMIEENYPLPMKGELKDRYSNYVLTKDVYKEVSAFSPMYGLDCEMCRTTSGDLELTRISVVNENLQVVYESFVKPYNRITDYLTRYSGITRQLLADVNVRLEDVQKDLRKLLSPDAILVGQSLNFDLQALRMMHPFVIDTSVIYNLTGDRCRKTKLSVLSQKFLKEAIQTSNKGHCSVEDSLASMKLAKLKLGHGVDFGDVVLSGRRAAEESRERQKQAQSSSNGQEEFMCSLFSHATNAQKSAAIVASSEVMSEYSHYVTKTMNNTHFEKNNKKHLQCLAEPSNAAIVARTCEIALDHHFTIAHLRYPSESGLDAKACQQFNSWCRAVWNQMACNGLCMILLGGKAQGANGACFIQIKKSPVPNCTPRNC